MRTFKYYISFTLLLLIFSSLIIPQYYGVPYIKSAGPLFTYSIEMVYKNHLIKKEPSLVILGDSTLKFGIVESYLTELLGQETYKIDIPGSASAVWYLILKNQIATSPSKPKHLVIFSRASMLTTPEYRTTGKYEKTIVEVAQPEDTLVIERAYLSQMNWLEKELDHFLPLFGYRARVRISIENIFKYRIPMQVLGVRQKEVDSSLDDVFSDDFRPREIVQLNDMITMAGAYLHEEERLNFSAQLPRSFLPEIVRICQENNIQLTLVYTKTIYAEQSEESARMLESYRKDLFQYAAENNINIIDYANDERVLESFFEDSVHMNSEGKHAFTEIFAADYAKLLP